MSHASLQWQYTVQYVHMHRDIKYGINTSFHGRECNMAGYCTRGHYFHLPLAHENTLPTRAISCHITLPAME